MSDAQTPSALGDEEGSEYAITLDRAGTRTPAHPVHDEIRLLAPDFYVDPHPRFTWMREHAPVYWDDATGIWGIASYEHVMQVSKHHEDFCSGKGSRPDSSVPSMINMDPPEHIQRRRIVSAGFTPRRVEDHEGFLREKVNGLLDRVEAQGRCDFVRDIATPLPMLMIGKLMGLPESDHDQLLEWSDLFATGGDEVRAEIPDAVRAYAEYIMGQVAKRRGGDGDDLVSLVVNAELEGDRLDDHGVIFETMLILVGGDETTRHVISGGLDALLRTPGEMARLQADRTLLPSAIEEMLRWVTPIQNMNRTATRDLELGGQQIREGDRMLLLYPSANRDEAVFDDPFRFDVGRTPNDHVAFGGFGRHHCLGAQLARLELRVLFETLLERLPGIALAEPDATPPRRRGNFVLGMESLPVVW